MYYKGFNRSGFASITDFEDENYLKLFHDLEKLQDEFITKTDFLRSNNYKWPKDALHNWSRIWEYPYVYYHVQNIIEKLNIDNNNITIVDLGSGVTFFPFALEKYCSKVICADSDPICIDDIEKRINYFKKNKSIIGTLSKGLNIPIKEESVDILYSISVLEHIEKIEDISIIIQDIYRVLKKNGIFILTVDVDLRGDAEIKREKYRLLQNNLLEKFTYLVPNISIHPLDILTTVNSPIPMAQVKDGLSSSYFNIKQKIKPFLGKKIILPPPTRLSVEGFILKKE